VTEICPCGRPLSGSALCSTCHHSLQVALGDISAHWADLDTVKARLTRYGASGGGRGGDKPLPVDARFLGWDADGTRLQDAVKNTIGTWARAVMGDRPELPGEAHTTCLHVPCAAIRRSRWPRDNVPAVCRYLLGQADWIRTQHWAPEILDELTDTAEQLRRMVDRPADKLFAGYCDECQGPLYAKVGAFEVACKTCGTSYSVKDRRDAMWAEAQDHNGTAAEISRAISWLGELPLSADRIYKWVERKRLTERGHVTYRGRLVPIYRIGDVAALAAASDQQKAG
jgi:uncharacterized Zn finger protein (UPF0148 family)